MVNNYQLRTTSYANRLSSPTCQLIMTSFMQNKPNFRKAKMNITSAITKDYEHEPRLRPPRKQTQSNPFFLKLKKPFFQSHPPSALNPPSLPSAQITRHNSSPHNTLRKLSYSAIAKPPTLQYKYVWLFWQTGLRIVRKIIKFTEHITIFAHLLYRAVRP